MADEALNKPASERSQTARFSLVGAALTLSGLCAFAIAQPLFDLLAGNVPFLIAHRVQPLELLALVGLVLAAPAAVAFAPAAFARLASPKLAEAVVSALVAVGAAAVVLPPLHRSLPGPGVALAAGALAIGAVAGLAHQRSAGVRSFARLLSLGVVGFPAWFLLLSPASSLLSAAPNAGAPLAEARGSTPVVFVVFDQFPLFTLLAEDETIDAARYPNFAALAEHADWFRNATTVAGETVLAVPALLSGRYPDAPRLPTYAEHPLNLFTLLGHDYHLNVVQTMTDLCPPELCPESAVKQSSAERMRGVAGDLGFLYLHVLLPQDLREGLPDVGSTWRDFEHREWLAQDATPEDPKSSWGDPTSAFARFLAGFDGRRERVLHFLHVNVPHVPWKYLPSGAVYGPVGRHLYPYPMNGLADVGREDGWALDRALQRHLLQVGFADRMLGKLVRKLEDDGLYDDALLVVTADHGITFWPTKGLDPSDFRAASDVLNVPMFVKRPHARTGSVDDTNVETVDLLPTIAALVGAEIPGEVDGIGLYGREGGERAGKRVFIDLDGRLSRIDYGAKIPGRRLSVRRMQRVFGPSDDPDGLFRVGRHRDWIGRDAAELRQRASAERRDGYVVELEFADAFRDVDPDGVFVPARVTGEVRTAAGSPAAREVAVAVNGRVWATTRTFESVDGPAGFAAMVPQHAFRVGENRVDVYVVDGAGDSSRLTLARKQARRRFALARAPDGTLELDCTDGRRIPVTPGAVPGRVNSRGAMLAGWARDARGDRLPETVVVFANGSFYEERDLARARSETAQRAHVAAEDTLAFDMVIPFEILRESDTPELRVFAISGSVASELETLPGFAYRGVAPSGG